MGAIECCFARKTATANTFPMSIYDLAYVSNKMVMSGKTINLRMNFSVHFNADKKIDRYTTYYDRSVIIKAMGRNMLEEIKE